MRNQLNIFLLKSALVFSVLFLNSLYSFGQKNVIELLPGSDSMTYDRKIGAHRLNGNVNFKYKNTLMYCDSAYFYDKNNIVKAYGNVHINKNDTLNLFCDSLHFNGNKQKAKLWGNVRLRDNEFKLTTDTLEYDSKTGQAFYKHGGKVQNIVKQGVLTSEVGYFHPKTKNFFFSHGVKYDRPDLSITTDTLQFLYSQHKTFFYGPTTIISDSTELYCEYGWYNTQTDESKLQQNAWISRADDYISADTLHYLPKEGISIGQGNVNYTDSIQKLSFKGDYAYNSDSLHYSFITGRALAIKEVENDTLYIHADTLFSFKHDTINIIKAYHGAKIYSENFQGLADSIIYAPKENKIELFKNPIIWANKAELKGEFITIEISDTIIEKVNIFNNATILMEIEPELYYNQIGGKDIVALFHENEIYRANVMGNATTIVFPEDEKVSDTAVTVERIGMNRLYASDLRIDIDSNTVSKIVYINQPEGVFYPMDKFNKEEQFVPNFKWLGAVRPKRKEDLLD